MNHLGIVYIGGNHLCFDLQFVPLASFTPTALVLIIAVLFMAAAVACITVYLCLKVSFMTTGNRGGEEGFVEGFRAAMHVWSLSSVVSV